ncbi:MAG TPA: nuclear transport factor 2 family protein [Acidimicrobiales bacterium]|nr:nuclear transport factor 2 family protein [Acidimicrobiales bacterium]
MGADDNIKTIQSVYEAFGRGDVGAILDNVTEDVDWATDTNSPAAPWYGVRHGHDGVTSFFEAFGSAMEVDEFTPLTVAANEDSVLTVVRCRARARATGRAIDMNLHHYFRFRGGKVFYYRGTEDVVQTEAALGA